MSNLTVRQFIYLNLNAMDDTQLIGGITSMWNISRSLANEMVTWARTQGTPIPWIFGNRKEKAVRIVYPIRNTTYIPKPKPKATIKAERTTLTLLRMGQTDSFILSMIHDHYPSVNAGRILERTKTIHDF